MEDDFSLNRDRLRQMFFYCGLRSQAVVDLRSRRIDGRGQRQGSGGPQGSAVTSPRPGRPPARVSRPGKAVLSGSSYQEWIHFLSTNWCKLGLSHS
ncbi:hypothetical protein INR49_022563 [Caranx melampygus]|nr:hypothetical protein INR49_022563 [Caranx melampygus]